MTNNATLIANGKEPIRDSRFEELLRSVEMPQWLTNQTAETKTEAR
jgi:hypothetical protein